ncbi:MAG: hypothetical protein GDA37_11135 [Ekhidna sp.]|nr:hypothetical protein [Ekhidna sp.]
MSTVLKYFTVYILSGLKFILGPAFGAAYDLPLIAIILLTAFGMMTTIYSFTFFGYDIRRFASRFRRNSKVFTGRNRKFVSIWRRYGLIGVCLLTPLLLSPPVGGLLTSLLETNKQKLIKWMWISALGWSVILSTMMKYAFWLIKYFV